VLARVRPGVVPQQSRINAPLLSASSSCMSSSSRNCGEAQMSRAFLDVRKYSVQHWLMMWGMRRTAKLFSQKTVWSAVLSPNQNKLLRGSPLCSSRIRYRMGNQCKPQSTIGVLWPSPSIDNGRGTAGGDNLQPPMHDVLPTYRVLCFVPTGTEVTICALYW